MVLPPSTWREIQGRASTLGIAVELLGGRLRAPYAPCGLEAPAVLARRVPDPMHRLNDRAGDGQGVVEYGLILALHRPPSPRSSWGCSAGRWPMSCRLIGDAIDRLDRRLIDGSAQWCQNWDAPPRTIIPVVLRRTRPF